ncbi:MAG: ATP-binding protein [Ruminococcus sp.]
MIEKTFPAETAALNEVLAFTEAELERAECPMKNMMQLMVAIEEVFVNVAHYAYPDGKGDVKLGISFDHPDHTVTFRIADKGIPFDPLAKPDPDITLSAEERQIGGLGILICKKTMDAIDYAYEDGQNILTMMKRLS